MKTLIKLILTLLFLGGGGMVYWGFATPIIALSTGVWALLIVPILGLFILIGGMRLIWAW